MEKRKQEIRKDYPKLRIYKNDLIKIIDIFLDNIDEFKSVSLSIGEYDLQEITDVQITGIENDELKKKKKSELEDSVNKIKEETGKEVTCYFRICASKSLSEDISLFIEDDLAAIRTNNRDNTIFLGIISQIDDILKRRRRIFTSTFFYLIGLLIYLILFALTLIKLGQTLYISIPIYILLIVAWSYFIFYSKSKRNLIYLYDFKEKPNFFKRKKDEIILLIIGTIFGVIIHHFWQILFK